MNLETVKKGLCTVLSPLLASGLSLTWPWTTVRTEFSLWVLDCLLSNPVGSVAMAALCPSLAESPLGVLEGHSWVPTSCVPAGFAVWRGRPLEKCSGVLSLNT